MKIGRNNVVLAQRRGLAAEWEAVNPILHGGELGVEGTPTVDMDRMKIGDGETPWNDLPYIAATDLGVNGVASPTLSSIIVIAESEFSQIAVKDPNSAYLVMPDNP
jgi:hypothetical protein